MRSLPTNPHDIKAFTGLLAEANKMRQVSKVLGDDAYNSGEVYEMLKVRGIEPVIKPRRNSLLEHRHLPEGAQ